MGVTNSRRKGGLWWGGLITGIIGAGGLTCFVYIVATIEWEFEPKALFDIIACGLLVFGSVYVAWKRPSIGWAILLMSNVVVTVVNSIIDIQSWAKFAGLATATLGIPSSVLLLISSILFLLLWRRRQKPVF
jgi:hypothetical protein